MFFNHAFQSYNAMILALIIILNVRGDNCHDTLFEFFIS
jgi:hypothetical protein